MPATTRREQRTCGISAGLVAWLVAAHLFRHGQTVAGTATAAFGLALVLIGVTMPAILALPSRVWWGLLRGLGWVNAKILLTVLFFGVMTPLGFALRLTGWDPLARRRPDGSFWVPYPARQRNTRHYERMY